MSPREESAASMKRPIEYILLSSLLWTTVGVTAPQLSAKLLFVKQSPAGCTINVWDPQSGQTESTAPLPVCPSHIFGIPEKNLILVTTPESIQEYRLVPLQENGAAIKLPVPPIKPTTFAAKPSIAGLTQGNLVTLVMESYYPYDDTDNFVYLRRSGDWILDKTVHCGRFDPCNFFFIRGNRDNIWMWPDQYRVWHVSQRENPFIVKSTERSEENILSRRSPDESPTTVGQLTFSFKASRSVLTYRTMSGPDTGATLTFEIDLQVNGEKVRILSGGQNETQLVGRYLLLDGFFEHGGIDLYDIETGKKVLGKLELAEWLFADNQDDDP